MRVTSCLEPLHSAPCRSRPGRDRAFTTPLKRGEFRIHRLRQHEGNDQLVVHSGRYPATEVLRLAARRHGVGKCRFSRRLFAWDNGPRRFHHEYDDRREFAGFLERHDEFGHGNDIVRPGDARCGRGYCARSNSRAATILLIGIAVIGLAVGFRCRSAAELSSVNRTIREEGREE